MSLWPQCIKIRCKRIPSLSRMKEALHAHIKGQENAIMRVLGHLESHLDGIRARKFGGPLVLHFAGDNGVGKSETARIVAEYMFRFHIGEAQDDQYAHFYTSGAHYGCKQCHDSVERARERAEHSERLQDAIITQIEKCKTSIIVINDIQSMMWEVLADLEVFMEGIINFKDAHISTHESIFIFTSDFRQEHRTSHMTEPELIKFIMSEFESFVPQRSRFHQFMTHVPFRSIDAPAFHDILNAYMHDTLACNSQVEKVEWDEEVLSFLVSMWEQDPDYRAANGRAASKKVVPDLVQPAIQDALSIEKDPVNIRLILNEGENAIGAIVHKASQLKGKLWEL